MSELKTNAYTCILPYSLMMSIKGSLKMSELKLFYKNKNVSKEVKQELKKTDPINLIDVYMSISLSMFPNKNIKIRNINEEKNDR